ncbi:MAG: hypothetical protein JWN25_188 [Verrucomicrobiales bacterium]|nr:hypothetical protein [Verrucomicrobiales bacterium]
MNRRSFLHSAATSGALLAGLEFSFLRFLPRVSAAEMKMGASGVSFSADIEPLVRFLEVTPRDRVIEEIGLKVKKGLSYRELLTALLLAGVRNIQPRPVGFKFHAVLVIHAAHLASLASPETDRWLPIFWAIDQFTSSQAADEKEGDWTMQPIDESAIPPSHKARKALVDALEKWDERAADAAIVGMVRKLPAHEIYEVLAKYGSRDYREIGHKEIYVANSFRALEIIGWQHAEPVLRSVVYAMLDRVGDKVNPSEADLPADRPFRRNLELVKEIQPGWLDGKPDSAATEEFIRTARTGSAIDTSKKLVELLNKGVAPQSLFDGYMAFAAELLMNAPGIISIHATTFTNATHYSWQHCRDEEVRKILMLQNAAFLPLFRGNRMTSKIEIEHLTPEEGAETPGEILELINKDKSEAARKLLGFLQHQAPQPFLHAARRLIFSKGNDAHDYKFSSAMMEDYVFMEKPWANRYMAASVFNLKGAGDKENQLANRIRNAL